jgi:hypothetical protein
VRQFAAAVVEDQAGARLNYPGNLESCDAHLARPGCGCGPHVRRAVAGADVKNTPAMQSGDRFLCRHAAQVCEVYLVTPHGYHFTMGGSKYFSPKLMPKGLENADWNDFYEPEPE